MRLAPGARVASVACVLLLAACGSGGNAAATGASGSPSSAGPAAVNVPAGDWTRFDFNASRSGIGPAQTGITARNLGSLRQRRVNLDGTVDSSPIELHAIRVHGRTHDLIIVTTTYGRTIALDAGTGQELWEFVPPDIRSYEGTPRITTTTPVADPGRRYVFAASPDGLIRKLAVATGHEIRSRHWPAHVTRDATHEKLASALNLSGREVIATTGGYVGDAPPYQGHVVTIERTSGRILHVWNSLCSGQHHLLVPSRCSVSDSAIWARSGAVVKPGSGRLLVATGNATGNRPFDGVSSWSDSVLELSPDAARLLHNWTPSHQAALSASDGDVGSTAPALLPPAGGVRLAVQGGKDGELHLLDLARLDGTSAGAGPRVGGELQQLPTPGGAELFSAPAVWQNAGRTLVFVADASGTGAYVLTGGSQPRLRLAFQNANPGTSPIVAGGLLYVYDPSGSVRVYEPTRLQPLVSLPAAVGHWNSPIVIGGRVIVPEGDANQHAQQGTLDIYHLPGR
ncbi:MAG: PQQ-binding-like beta-propeller repeat protein [Solirubrobacteraceae bacterium]